MDKLKHFKFFSSIDSGSLTPWYETVDNEQVFSFVDQNGVSYNVNSLTLFTEASELYFEIPSDSGYAVYVPANSSINVDYLLIKNFKILAPATAKFRYYAMAY